MAALDFVLNQEIKLARIIEGGVAIFKEEGRSVDKLSAFSAACVGVVGERDMGLYVFMELQKGSLSDTLSAAAEFLGITVPLAMELYARGYEGVKAEAMVTFLRREDWQFTLRSPRARRQAVVYI